MAGLVAAQRLRERGIRVVVFEKGRGVGGRMATRRIARGVFDYGAQFFTVRDQRFGRMVDEWRTQAVVQDWCRGFPNADGTWTNDGHFRYRGATGMTAIAKYIARGVEVRKQERVIELKTAQEGWQVRTEGGAVFTTHGVILTPPVPQCLALIDAGVVTLPGAARDALEQVTYNPCIAVMALLDGPSRIPAPGGVQLSGEPVAWIADNCQKGISPGAWGITIHAGPVFTRGQWNSDDDKITESLLGVTKGWIGSMVISAQVHRWRYSQPVRMYPEPCLPVSVPAPLVFAGDAFGGPRVEGAALSGLAAADWLLSGPWE